MEPPTPQKNPPVELLDVRKVGQPHQDGVAEGMRLTVQDTQHFRERRRKRPETQHCRPSVKGAMNKNPGCYATLCYRVYIYIYIVRIPIEQSGFSGK